MIAFNNYWAYIWFRSIKIGQVGVQVEMFYYLKKWNITIKGNVELSSISFNGDVDTLLGELGIVETEEVFA